MRILHIIPSFSIGGAEKLITEIAPIMRDTGHEVTVLAFDGKESFFKEELVQSGIQVLSFGTNCSVYNPIFIIRLHKLIRCFDVIHSHLTSPQFFTAIAGLLSNKVLVTTEHSTTNRRRGRKWLRLTDKWMYLQYDSIIAISNKTEESLKEYLGKISTPIITISNGINIHRIQIAPPLDDGTKLTSKKVITMVGAFRPEKDQQTLISAYKKLNNPDLELWFVGDGERKNEMVRLVDELGLSDSVRFWGNRNDVPSILKSSDVIVLSSHWEGFGLAAAEGMAAGKPVIASNVEGLAQVVGNAGLLFETGNIMQLASLIQLLLDDSVLYANIAKKCLARAQLFDISIMAEEYLKVYQECILRKKRLLHHNT